TFGNLTLRFTKDGKEAFSLDGHSGTVFVVKEGILYYAHYSSARSGCFVIAYNLANGKELWKTRLKGIGEIVHFGYDNSVALSLVDGAIRVLGHESAGNYIEFVDLKEGKTVGNRVF